MHVADDVWFYNDIQSRAIKQNENIQSQGERKAIHVRAQFKCAGYATIPAPYLRDPRMSDMTTYCPQPADANSRDNLCRRHGRRE